MSEFISRAEALRRRDMEVANMKDRNQMSVMCRWGVALLVGPPIVVSLVAIVVLCVEGWIGRAVAAVLCSWSVGVYLIFRDLRKEREACSCYHEKPLMTEDDRKNWESAKSWEKGGLPAADDDRVRG